MLLEELRHSGLALLFITHNLALVSAIADRVLVLQKGRARAIWRDGIGDQSTNGSLHERACYGCSPVGVTVGRKEKQLSPVA
jgi:ABC-type sugar transport system ATPase subunit